MELDFDKYCVVDGSPMALCPAVRHSNVPNILSNRKPKAGNQTVSDDGDFTRIRFDSYSRSRKCNQEDSKMLRRGSSYRSSEEVMQLQRSDAAAAAFERKKIAFSGRTEPMSSVGIIDSLCYSDEDTSPVDQDRFSEQSTSSFCSEQMEIRPWGFVNYGFHPIPGRIDQQKITSLDERDELSTDLTITSKSAAAAITGGNSSHKRNPAANLHKSLLEKLALSKSPVQSRSDGSKSSCPDCQFNPGRKILDPFIRSKSPKSPLSRISENGSMTRSGDVDSSGNGTLHKSVLNMSSDMGHNPRCEKKENRKSGLLCSPTHLHGLLTLKTKRGIPFFKFSVKLPEENYVARTWKVDNTLNWIYTFHSVNYRRNSNAIAWRFKDKNRDSSMVGQMLVSCYLSTELKVAGASSDSMVTEFVLYDIARLRQSNASQDNSSRSHDSSTAPLASEQSKISIETENKVQVKHSCDGIQSELSATSQPLPAAKLSPALEIAAIIIQVPFEPRESLKYKSGDAKISIPNPKLLNLCHLEQADTVISDPGKMHVVIPAGHHSLPNTESRGPSPLLDRWRLGGECDCGGWDLACPLTVFNSQNFHVVDGQSVLDNCQPAELFHEGRKEDGLAFSMRAVEEGNYAVDFHARLSSLEAFSICVALLHAAEEHDRCRPSLQSDAPMLFSDKEFGRFTDAIMDEQNLKPNKIIEPVMPSFVLNPLCSPLARV